jgi:xanthine/uracil permease
VFGYLLYGLLSNILHFGGPYIDLNSIGNAPLLGWPALTAPQFDMHAITLIVPVAIVLVAENLGHIKAVAAMTGRDLDPYIGRAFLADGVATMVSGSGGGTGVTTYAENIGVMGVTKIYSSLVFVIAAVVAILLGFSPMFGAVVHSIPQAVLGGMAIVLFGLIAVTGARIWVENKVDFTDNKNFITAAVALTLGAGNLVITQGDFSIGGIGTACIGALVIYQILNKFGTGKKAE